MLEEFDSLAITTENYDKLTTKEKIERAKKRKELLKQMSEEEINELLSRPYPTQFKEVIKKSRK